MATLNRIVSLIPSTSKTLCDLGLREDIVGITSFCVDPPSLHKSARIIGGTKDVNIELIRELKPSHIFANHEENTAECVANLRDLAPIHLSHPQCVEDVVTFLEGISAFLGKNLATATLVETIRKMQKSLKDYKTKSKKFLYFIWDQPLMVAGVDTYISSLLEEAGLNNALHLHEPKFRYPTVSIELINQLQADYLFFSSEPFPFKNRQILPYLAQLDYQASAYKIDGQLMSWHGSLTAEALDNLLRWREGKPGEWLRQIV